MACIRWVLPSPDAAIEEQWVERDRRIGHAAGRRIGKLVRLADHKVIEREPRVQACGKGIRLGGRVGTAIMAHHAKITFDGCYFTTGLATLSLADLDTNTGQRVVLATPEIVETFTTARHDPILHVAAGNAHHNFTSRDTIKRKRAQPCLECCLTQFSAQTTANALPLVFHIGI